MPQDYPQQTGRTHDSYISFRFAHIFWNAGKTHPFLVVVVGPTCDPEEGSSLEVALFVLLTGFLTFRRFPTFEPSEGKDRQAFTPG